MAARLEHKASLISGIIIVITGVAKWHGSMSVDTLLKAADKALYQFRKMEEAEWKYIRQYS
ncbi:hypothetical protein [Klebsiella aerogenes]|uniref:GGDEF domain-containing protein n=1 Tax=Klebsiella aerogenes TaxID=548 RepID=A0AAP9R1E6_KLEAE|nr:hypothetical protein [Klebsiella aerogenes]QMR42866.1 hypothetical protein HV331_25430 [Klebsiella aerogenes]